MTFDRGISASLSACHTAGIFPVTGPRQAGVGPVSGPYLGSHLSPPNCRLRRWICRHIGLRIGHADADCAADFQHDRGACDPKRPAVRGLAAEVRRYAWKTCRPRGKLHRNHALAVTCCPPGRFFPSRVKAVPQLSPLTRVDPLQPAVVACRMQDLGSISPCFQKVYYTYR